MLNEITSSKTLIKFLFFKLPQLIIKRLSDAINTILLSYKTVLVLLITDLLIRFFGYKCRTRVHSLITILIFSWWINP